MAKIFILVRNLREIELNYKGPINSRITHGWTKGIGSRVPTTQAISNTRPYSILL